MTATKNRTLKAYEKLKYRVPATIALSSAGAMFIGSIPLMPVEPALLSSVMLGVFSFASYHYNSSGKVLIATVAGFLSVLFPSFLLFMFGKAGNLVVPAFMSVLFAGLVFVSARQSRLHGSAS